MLCNVVFFGDFRGIFTQPRITKEYRQELVILRGISSPVYARTAGKPNGEDHSKARQRSNPSKSKTFERRAPAAAWMANQDEVFLTPGEIEQTRKSSITLGDVIDRYLADSIGPLR